MYEDRKSTASSTLHLSTQPAAMTPPIHRPTQTCPSFHPTSPSNLVEEPPILDLERFPDLRRVLDGTLDQLSLLPHLHINLLGRILALDMRHVDRHQDIRALTLQPNQRQHYRRKIRALRVRLRRRRLRGDEGIGWGFFAATSRVLVDRKKKEERSRRGRTHGSFENCVLDVFHTLTVSSSESTMSSRWVVRAAPSMAGPVPGRPTRSVMSKMILVKPSLSR